MEALAYKPLARCVRIRAFTLLYVGVAIGALAGFASFAVDWGRVQLCKTELQRAADAGARAAASQLPLGITAVQTAAVTFAGDNTADSASVVIDPNNDVEFGTWNTAAKTFTVLTGAARTSANAVRVTARRVASRGTAVPLIFGQLIGVPAYDAQKSSIATYYNTSINYSGGFTGTTALYLVNAAVVSGSKLQMTTAAAGWANNAAWYNTKVPVNSFTCMFTFQCTSATADGFTFAIQNSGTAAVGSSGGGLGYQGIGTSVGIKFDIYNNSGEGVSSTGLYLNGANPANVSSCDMSGAGVLLKSGHVMRCDLSYDGRILTETVTDTSTNAFFTTTYSVSIPATVGSSTAYAGFTGATGGANVATNINTWTYSSPGALAYVR